MSNDANIHLYEGKLKLSEQMGDYVDSHAHIFTLNLPMLKNRRYTPEKVALPSTYRALLNTAKLHSALLVQPSFLGTDNRYLLKILRHARADKTWPRLWGAVVIPPETSRHTIAKMSESGVVGTRLNLIHKKTPDFRSARWQRFFRYIDDAGWHLEIHAEGGRIAKLLDVLSVHCQRIVIDHFGLPSPHAPLACSGLRAIMSAHHGQIWVKLSGAYRVFPNLHPDAAAQKCNEISRALLEQLGSRQLLWGSDWPWTQYEKVGITYMRTLEWRHHWLSNSQDGYFYLLKNGYCRQQSS